MRDNPNVLLIVTDQEQSWTTLPDQLRLPSHERLREQGVSFSRFHVNCSPCGPSRSNLYTGQHTQHTHMHVNPDNPPLPELPTNLSTFGHLFREAGYYTAYKGKWHLSHINKDRNFCPSNFARYPDTTDVLEPYGFSDYNFFGDTIGYAWDGYRNDAMIAGDAAKLLYEFGRNNKTQDKPWLLAVNFINPHDIMFFDATGRQNETRVLKNVLSPLVGVPGDPLYQEELGFDLPESFYTEKPDTKPEIQAYIRSRQSAFYGELPLNDEENWRRFRNYYFNCIRDVDRHIGTVLDALERSGMAEHTVIVMTSDHGERAGAHGMQQKAGTVYEEEVAIPFIVVHPDVSGGIETPALGSMVDVLPTLLGLAGIDTPSLDVPPVGVDLSTAVSQPTNETERDRLGSLLNYTGTFHWQRIADSSSAQSSLIGTNAGGKPSFDLSKRRMFRGVIWDRYKFVRYFAPAEHHRPINWETLVKYNDLELYDQQADPSELLNLAVNPEEHRELLEHLNALTNELIEREVGEDNGQDYPGPAEQYNTIS